MKQPREAIIINTPAAYSSAGKYRSVAVNELVKLHLAAVAMLLKQSTVHPLWNARPHHTVAL